MAVARMVGMVTMTDGTTFDFRITVERDGRIVHNGYTHAGASTDAVDHRLHLVSVLDDFLRGESE